MIAPGDRTGPETSGGAAGGARDGVEAHAEVHGVDLAFGRRVVFADLECRFPRARISVVMGRSGSGKSTLLRMLAGLQLPDRGEVVVAGEPLTGGDGAVLRRVRARLGMLFQNSALLDSMTVFDNLALPLREHRDLSEREVAERVHERLEAVGLSDVDELLPGSLSGGMLKRAALARSIINDPEILLCDEPFSGLDPVNVARIEGLLAKLNRERDLTVIVSSHHVASSLRMGDQLVLLQEGQALCGAPRALAASGDERVRSFLGAEATALAAFDSRSAAEAS